MGHHTYASELSSCAMECPGNSPWKTEKTSDFWTLGQP